MTHRFSTPWWDVRAGWTRLPSEVGIDPASLRIFRGAVPGPDFGEPIGNADEWVNGLSYATYIAGGYDHAIPCVPVNPTVMTAIVAGKGTVMGWGPHHWFDYPAVPGRATMAFRVTISTSSFPSVAGKATVRPDGQIQGHVTVTGLATITPAGTVQGLVSVDGKATVTNLSP